MTSPNPITPRQRIIIVGGGAGGLELAAKLGRKFGPETVTLVDARPFHIWKPSLHEAAAGTLDIHQEGLSYFMLARQNGFTFVMGALVEVARHDRTVRIAALKEPDGEVILPERNLRYDTLVLAVGSVSNFFGTPGAKENAVTLDTLENAEQFRLTMLKAMAQVDEAKKTNPDARLDIVIVGGGATGVELSVELVEAGETISAYGLPRFKSARDLSITLIEGAPRLLVALPERISIAARARLTSLGIHVETDARVANITSDSVETADGRSFPARIALWAAGIQGPEVLKTLDLPLARSGQLEINGNLQSPDPAIYALGDCSSAPWKEGRTVPARAQAAHQQADYLFKRLSRHLRGQPLDDTPYRYEDQGSLISLGQSAGVGSLMGKLAGRGLFVSGTLARLMYMSLHLMHHQAILGVWRTGALALGRLLMRRSRPRVKLH